MMRRGTEEGQACLKILERTLQRPVDVANCVQQWALEGSGAGYFRSMALDQIATLRIIRRFTRAGRMFCTWPCSSSAAAGQPWELVRFVSRVDPVPGPSTGVNCCELL